MVSGVLPNVFCTRIRTAVPPWLRWVTMRTDWLSSGAAARPSWDCAQEVNQLGRAPSAAGAEPMSADATSAKPAANTVTRWERIVFRLSSG
jgi:hypothetical protein